MSSHTRFICSIWCDYLVDNSVAVYLKNVVALSSFFVRKCAWWGKVENRMGSKETDFLPFTCNEFGKMHFASKLIYCSVDIYYFLNPLHPLKIRPHVTGSFRENFRLKHRCSLKGSLLSINLRSHQNRWRGDIKAWKETDERRKNSPPVKVKR